MHPSGFAWTEAEPVSLLQFTGQLASRRAIPHDE